jgi:hypothetical protein
MALTLTSAPASELLSVEDAKRHLRLMSGDLDDEVAARVREARDDCERETQRTLRASVTRVLTRHCWWPQGSSSGYGGSLEASYRNGCGDLKLPWPPLLGVTSITYYDADNASQTLSSSNYYVELSTEGFGRIIWKSTATIPVVYDRPDAVTITFTTGYASADTIPPAAIAGIKLRLTELWGRGTENEIKAAVDSSCRLLGKVDATGYA